MQNPMGVAAYYQSVFKWARLESFVTCNGRVPFSETLWKFIYLNEPDRWSKWRWFPSVDALRAYVLDSFNGFRKPIVTINYGQMRTLNERILTFDVDLNDYGDVRSLICDCGTLKQACGRCWNFWMTYCVIPAFRKCLEETWGFKDVTYVFSGRRGLHVHVRDKRATRMTAHQRLLVLSSFKQIDMTDTWWSLLTRHGFANKTREQCPWVFEHVLCCFNPLPGQYFGGLPASATLKEHCDYLERAIPTRQQWLGET